MPITAEGQRQAHHAGAWIAAHGHDVAAVLYGGTRRTRETAEGVLAGLGGAGEVPVSDCFALRNPDLYLGGERVSMVSSAQAFADQTSGLAADDVDRVEFFHEWLTHPERVGFWVAHKNPPGDDAASVERRIAAFAASLYDVPRWRGRTIVAITHSPVLRSVGLGLRGTDPGEPAYVTGYAFTASAEALHIDDIAPATS